MNGIHRRKPVSLIVVGCIFAVLVLGSACADSDNQSEATQGEAKRWTRIEFAGSYSFNGNVREDKDLSGIACVSEKYCLVGADEGREVQVVELSRPERALSVERTVSLLDSGEEIDIEAIAVEGDDAYIVGSHGVSKKQGEHQSNRYRIFRLTVDRATGVPVGTGGPGRRAPVGLKVASLSRVLRADPVLGEYFQKPLQEKGLNIEGLAVRNGRLFVGFRNPNLGGYAYVMEIRAEDVFAETRQPDYTLHKLRLGQGLGIREMVAAKSCFLVIAGNASSEPSEKYRDAQGYDEDRDFSMYTWDGNSPNVHKIGPIPNVPGKAEAMTILDESADHVTVLVLFDGPKGGRPSVYRID